jgi:mannose-6-phosphate isomerase-like protein (cupin superfamily)
MDIVRRVRIVLIVLAALVQTDAGMHAQGSGILVRHRAPTDRALDFQMAALQAEFAEMKAQKRASTRLVEGGTFSMNARYLTGAESAQIHKTITEFYFVREGTATLVTGGTIINKTIRGGVERVITPGDAVFIPAGVPHMIRETTGISYLNIHFGGTD